MFADDIEKEICIRDRIYKLAEHPSFSGVPFGQEGRQGTVYKLINVQDGSAVALKVFRPAFRQPTLRKSAEVMMHHLSSLSGLSISKREVLHPEEDMNLLSQYSELLYSVVMPWIEGMTWNEFILSDPVLTKMDCLELAVIFANVLVNLEQQGVSHSDLSASNVLLTGLDQHEDITVELVDIEDIFAEGLMEPDYELKAEYGYTPKFISDEFPWGKDSSRFAGAMLLCEMLAWHSPDIRAVASSECYFVPEELQEECERYSILHTTLEQSYGTELVSLLHRVWHAETMNECPTFGEWMIALASIQAQIESQSKVEAEGQIEEENKDVSNDDNKMQFPFVIEEIPEEAAIEEVERREVKTFLAPEIYTTLATARKLEQSGKLSSALWEYGRLLEKVAPFPELHKEIELVMQIVQGALDDSLSVKKESTGLFNKRASDQGKSQSDDMYKKIWIIVWVASALLVLIAWIIYLI